MKMVTQFNRKDLGSFGEYLLSQERTNRILSNYKEGDSVSKEERLQEIYQADVDNWIDSLSKIQKVRAKFKCNNVDKEGGDSRNVQMDVVISGSPENEEFNEYTPYGQFNIGIDKGAKALELFEEGREYYIDITKAPVE